MLVPRVAAWAQQVAWVCAFVFACFTFACRSLRLAAEGSDPTIECMTTRGSLRFCVYPGHPKCPGLCSALWFDFTSCWDDCLGGLFEISRLLIFVLTFNLLARPLAGPQCGHLGTAGRAGVHLCFVCFTVVGRSLRMAAEGSHRTVEYNNTCHTNLWDW